MPYKHLAELIQDHSSPTLAILNKIREKHFPWYFLWENKVALLYSKLVRKMNAKFPLLYPKFVYSHQENNLH